MLFRLNKLGNQADNGETGPLKLTQASGEAFPVWNTVAGNNKTGRLSLCGQTIQPGTPAPESPVEFKSVGDAGLMLTVASAREGGTMQTFSFGDIVLRSLPSGVRDEIVYEAGLWKHIQKVGILRATQRPQWGTGYDPESNSVVCGFWVLPDSDGLLGKYDAAVCNRLTRSAINTNVPKGVNEFAVGQSSVGTYTTARFSAGIFTGLEEGLTKNNQLIIASWLQENPLYFAYPLANPVETAIDLPIIPTYAGETWFMTNRADVKPFMQADIKVRSVTQPVKGLSAWWDAFGRSNKDTEREIWSDLSGNGHQLTLTNFAFEEGSGWKDNTLEADGVDDVLAPGISYPEMFGESQEFTLFFAAKDFTVRRGGHFMAVRNNTSGQAGYYRNYIEAGKTFTGGAYWYGSNSTYITNNNIYLTNKNILNIADPINVIGNPNAYFSVLGNWDSDHKTFAENINAKLSAILVYNRILSEEERNVNLRYLEQRYGMEDLHGVDFPQTGLVGWWDVIGKTNEEKYRGTLFNKVNEEISLNLYANNFAFTPESGYEDGVLRFDGVDDYVGTNLQDWGSSEKTVFVITAPFEASQTRAFTFLSGELASISAGGRLEFMSDANAGYSVIQSPVGYYDFTRPHIVAFTRQDLSAKGFLDGELVGESTDFKDHGWLMYFQIGGITSRGFPFAFIGTVLYNRMLSDQEVQQITNFLKQKYGL